METLAETRISIYAIEDALAERGYSTEYVGDDDRTYFSIQSEGAELVLVNAMSGSHGHYDREDLTDAVFQDSRTVTRYFEDAETLEEFLQAVDEVFDR